MDYQELCYLLTGMITATVFACLIYIVFIGLEWLMDKCPKIKEFIEKYC